MEGPESHLRRRDGFTLTDPRMTGREVLSEVNYCVLCHEREKDSCATGLFGKDGKVQENPLGIPLEGCPLDERISEMHLIRKRGDAVGALALVTVDNPMCAGTGHRICNDCMKACIFQKQDPVNIPQIETGILTDVLRLPWGVEIYGLLTRWNPLNVRRPYALPYNGRKVLVVGMGPAGYTLAHYLVNEGFGVVGVDGLKIEPLPEALTGTDTAPPEPVRDWAAIYSPLDERPLEGFGGVSEYGITVRWDKNFLDVDPPDARAALQPAHVRRHPLRRHPLDGRCVGVRVRPRGDCRRRGQADDCRHEEQPAARHPAGQRPPDGAAAHGRLQARRLRQPPGAHALRGHRRRPDGHRHGDRGHGVLSAAGREDPRSLRVAVRPVRRARHPPGVRRGGTGAARRIPRAWSRGARRAGPGRGGRRAAPNFVPLMRRWGGVSLVYRKGMLDSPAYRLNHEEITKSLEEGIAFVERMNPEEAIPDDFGHVSAVRFREQINENGKWRDGDTVVTLPARSVFVAAGTTPNVTYEREYPGTFQMDERRRFFKPHVAERAADGAITLVPASEGFFTSYSRDGKHVTYYGDNHPKYAGNVVKAMASARDGYPHVVRLFPRGSDRRARSLSARRGRRTGSVSRRASITTSSLASNASSG